MSKIPNIIFQQSRTTVPLSMHEFKIYFRARNAFQDPSNPLLHRLYHLAPLHLEKAPSVPYALELSHNRPLLPPKYLYNYGFRSKFLCKKFRI